MYYTCQQRRTVHFCHIWSNQDCEVAWSANHSVKGTRLAFQVGHAWASVMYSPLTGSPVFTPLQSVEPLSQDHHRNQIWIVQKWPWKSSGSSPDSLHETGGGRCWMVLTGGLTSGWSFGKGYISKHCTSHLVKVVLELSSTCKNSHLI